MGEKKQDCIYLKIPGFENLLLQTTTRHESGQLTWKISDIYKKFLTVRCIHIIY